MPVAAWDCPGQRSFEAGIHQRRVLYHAVIVAVLTSQRAAHGWSCIAHKVGRCSPRYARSSYNPP